MMSAKGLFYMLCVGLVATVTLSQPQATAQPLSADQQESINKDLKDIASLLAHRLGDSKTLDLILVQTRAARSTSNTQQKLDLETTVEKAAALEPIRDIDWNKIQTAMDGVDLILRGPTRTEEDKTRFDFYFPVKEHRLKWLTATDKSDLLVAYVPVGPDENMGGITAYSVKDGSVLTLDPKTPPDQPTLVVGLDNELEPPDPNQPLMEVGPPVDADEGDEEPNDSNSWIGVPWIYLVDDHEPWLRGDAEVYVLVAQYRNSQVITHKKSLTKVDHDGKWYNLGDGPGSILYFYWDATYSPLTYFHFWESDGGTTIPVNFNVNFGVVSAGVSFNIKDGDDDMGWCTVDRNSVPWTGTRRFSTGDVKIDVDKDP